MTNKLSKQQAGYEDHGHKDSHCGPTAAYGDTPKDDQGSCKHFQKTKSLHNIGGCRIVLGVIERKGWCKFFTRVAR